MIKNISIKALIVFSSLGAQAQMQSVSTSQNSLLVAIPRGEGQIAGSITEADTFRIKEIRANVATKFKVGGEFVNDLSPSEFKRLCGEWEKRAPKAINYGAKSVKLSGVVFPYTKDELSQVVGREVENPIALHMIKPVLSFSDDSLTALNFQDVPNYAAQIEARLIPEIAKVNKGQVATLDLTKLASVACDLVNGKANLSFILNINHERAEAEVFVPVTSDEVSSISRELNRYTWSSDSMSNAYRAGAVLIMELSKFKKVEISMNDLRPAKETINKTNWTAQTLSSLMNELFDVQTFKPKILNAADSRRVSEVLTEKTYSMRAGQVSVTADFTEGNR